VLVASAAECAAATVHAFVGDAIAFEFTLTAKHAVAFEFAVAAKHAVAFELAFAAKHAVAFAFTAEPANAF